MGFGFGLAILLSEVVGFSVVDLGVVVTGAVVDCGRARVEVRVVGAIIGPRRCATRMFETRLLVENVFARSLLPRSMREGS